MKEATGELNMTVITVIAIAAVAGLFYAFVWPMIQRAIVNNTCGTLGNYEAVASSQNSTGCITAEGVKTSSTSATDLPAYICCPIK